MNLEDELARHPLLTHARVDRDHRELDDVCRGALHGVIHRRALAKVAQVGVARQDVRNVTLATVHRGRPDIAFGKRDGLVKVATHAGISRKVAVDHLLRLRARDAKRRGEAVGLLSVDDAEVHCLSATAHHGRDLGHGHAKDTGGRLGMEVLALAEGRDEMLVAGEMREQAQLDLRVIAREKHATRSHLEGRAHAMPKLGTSRDVLQVGV